jgi:uncharacterized protein involved in exopolysaccharide biosynthesis
MFILIVSVLLLVLAALAYLLMQPDSYQVQRSMTVNRPVAGLSPLF